MRTRPRGMNARVWAALALGLGLGACGGKTTRSDTRVRPDTSTLFASGTRLKAHYLDGGGGARQLLAFHDTVLDVECNFEETATGQYYCLPAVGAILFADAACTAPVILDLPGACPADSPPSQGTLVSAQSPSCDAQFGAYSVGADLTVDRSYFLDIGGTCEPPKGTQPVEHAGSLTRESLARFVAGTAAPVGAPGGAAGLRVTGADGSFANVDLVANGAPCGRVVVAGSERCVPWPFAQRSSEYADATCDAQDLAEVYLSLAQKCAGSSAHFLVEYGAKDCKENDEIYATGEELDRVFTQEYLDPTHCVVLDEASPSYIGKLHYRIAEAVPGSMFPVLHQGPVGDGALTIDCMQDASGAAIYQSPASQGLGQWALRDGTPCRVMADATGTKRCLDNALERANDVFSDPSCTQPVYETSVSCAQPPAKYLIERDTCRTQFTQAFLAKEYAGPVYAMGTAPCRPYSAPEATFYVEGSPVDASIFPVIADTTDQ